ncbi:xylose isomerase [Roseicitreum antarcticum]|uniref:Xylose isomerase n=1 Tax=Roseicitreum antarcticum TaxID=564137 RepID=A0A1H3BWR7_9RHOB|nr:xylose isomerase [Roseicitreum antarcticum]SDX46241.1 xylose isomerase [Roseicitreum antarcticum]
MSGYFSDIAPVSYDPQAEGLAFRHYNPDEVILGKPMAENLRFAVAYWHSFCWEGGDPFGGRTFDRPWFPADTMALAEARADAAFDFFRILGVPYFCFHDHDVRPEGATLAESHDRLNRIADVFAQKMAAGGPKLLWGTANLFSNRRYMSGAATNPDPDVFAYSASTVRTVLEVTHRLGGENYVLWGGREGYETLLNTDMKQERLQAGRFLSMVVEHKHKIGFKGTILIEPKPQEPTKHQYDYDVATVYGFLKDFGLEGEVKVNIEQGHAILAGHSFEHELALAGALGILGSIDMNRNDYQSGWDTDQFPNNVPETALAYYEILRAGGFTTGGTNFDAKLRRQSLDAEDLVAAHVGAMDVCARGFKAAAQMLQEDRLEGLRRARYAGWQHPDAQAMLAPGASLSAIADSADARGIDPQPVSGRQEILENLVNRYV